MAVPVRFGMTTWRSRIPTFRCCWPANMRLTRASPNPICPTRQAVVEAAKRFIREFHPEVIYTGHPDERHVGPHRTNNWFVVKALQELLREGVVPGLTLHC